jgi:hypothetical protein
LVAGKIGEAGRLGEIRQIFDISGKRSVRFEGCAEALGSSGGMAGRF